MGCGALRAAALPGACGLLPGCLVPVGSCRAVWCLWAGLLPGRLVPAGFCLPPVGASGLELPL